MSTKKVVELEDCTETTLDPNKTYPLESYLVLQEMEIDSLRAQHTAIKVALLEAGITRLPGTFLIMQKVSASLGKEIGNLRPPHETARLKVYLVKQLLDALQKIQSGECLPYSK